MNLATKTAVASNLLLLGLVLWLAGAGLHSGKRVNSVRDFARHELQANTQTKPPRFGREKPASVVEIAEPFRWAQLESTEYHDYLANLRVIGCPEPTVRDILIADVNELYASRVRSLVDEVSGRFWELLLRPDDFARMIENKHTQLRALENERDQLFEELFGESDPRSAERRQRQTADQRMQWESIGDFLSAEKRERFILAQEEFASAWAACWQASGQTGEEKQAQRKALEGVLDQTLRATFTPEEYHELRLRQSPIASRLQQLVGLDWNEETVRAVANAQFVAAESAPASTQLAEAQARDLIGPEAFAALQRALDRRYEPIYRVTQRLELPDTAAAQAYDIRRQAEEAAIRLQADQTLAPESQRAQLEAVERQTQQTLSVVLGAQGLAAYEKVDGDWLRRLTDPRR